MIEVRGVTKAFGPQRALVNVDLTIGAGEWVMLTGLNGAGKTTLLRILATLAQPSSGSVRLFGLNPRRHGAQIRRQIGYLSHRTLLYPDLSAEQNLRFYARCYGLNDSAARIAELLEQANLTARRHDLVATYSRGMQQRLALARALLHAPRLLLLDEPYTGLDTFAAEELTAMLGQLHSNGCTLVLATHTWEGEAFPAQRAIILQRGRLIHDAPLGERTAFPALYRQVVTQGTSPQPVSASAPVLPETPAAAPEAPPTAPLPGFWRQVGALLAKDLAAEWHTRELLSAVGVFAVLALLIFSFALNMQRAAARAAVPGVLWTTLAFAGTLGLSRSLAREQVTGGLEGMLLTPVERTAIFAGKALGNWLLMLVVALVLWLLSAVLFNLVLWGPGLLPVLLLGTGGYAVVGTLLAAIAVNTRAREVLLPVLLLPLAIPLLIAAVQATGALVQGLGGAATGHWQRLLGVYDLLAVAVALLTFEHVVEE